MTDLVYLGITAALILLTWGLMKICEVPADGSRQSSVEQKELPNAGSEAGGRP